MTTSTELVNLNELDTFTKLADVLQFFANAGVDITDNDADGIKSLRVLDKDSLVGVPFVLAQWRFNEGDFGDFVSAEIFLKDGTIGVLNDGSTGIRDQLRTLTQHRTNVGHKSPQGGRMVEGGLSKTAYWFNETTGETSSKKPDGKEWRPASTFYLQF